MREFDEQLARDGTAGRYAHRMDGDTQWHYDDWLAEQCGPDTPPLPPWRQRMYEITGDVQHRALGLLLLSESRRGREQLPCLLSGRTCSLWCAADVWCGC